MGVFTNTRRTPTRPFPDPDAPLTGSASASTAVLPRPATLRITPPTPNTSHSPAFRAVRPLTAAARPIDLRSSQEVARLGKRHQGDAWQTEAWEYYDAIGEIKYAFSLVASVLSRLRLYAGEITDPSQAPKPADPESIGGGAAISAVARLDSAFGGQPGLLRDAALNLSVPGECYLVQQPGNPLLGIPESWDIRSTDELVVDADGRLNLVTRAGAARDERKKLPKDAFVTRIWRPHPRYSDEADSSMRGILDACAELLLLNRAVRSTARSRLNSGLLYLPDGISNAGSTDPDVVFNEDSEVEDSGTPGVLPTDVNDTVEDDGIEEALIEAMTTPIADEESAAAVVPLILRGPADFADKLKYLKFERTFDPHLVSRADKVMDRILAGLDLPKDVVQGLAGVKYSNAVVIEESLLKSHIEPLALLICDALTVGYLRPALKAMGVEPSELRNYVVWYDASDVTTRPNRAEDADLGYGKQLINGEAWRREHGFTEEDAPTSTEVAIRLLLDKAAMTPELTESLLQVFAPDVMANVRAASQANSPAPLPPDVAQALGGGPAAEEPAAPAPPDVPPGGGEQPAASPPPPDVAPPAPGGAPTIIDAEDLQ